MAELADGDRPKRLFLLLCSHRGRGRIKDAALPCQVRHRIAAQLECAGSSLRPKLDFRLGFGFLLGFLGLLFGLRLAIGLRLGLGLSGGRFLLRLPGKF